MHKAPLTSKWRIRINFGELSGKLMEFYGL
jgi:hypothetical protein